MDLRDLRSEGYGDCFIWKTCLIKNMKISKNLEISQNISKNLEKISKNLEKSQNTSKKFKISQKISRCWIANREKTTSKSSKNLKKSQNMHFYAKKWKNIRVQPCLCHCSRLAITSLWTYSSSLLLSAVINWLWTSTMFLEHSPTHNRGSS